LEPHFHHLCSLGSTETRDGRVFWRPSTYTIDILRITEQIDCGPEGDAVTEQNIDQAFKRAREARKEFRRQRKLDKQTLSPDELRAKRNTELAEWIVAARRRQEEQAAA
jgi:hypothetical protein